MRRMISKILVQSLTVLLMIFFCFPNVVYADPTVREEELSLTLTQACEWLTHEPTQPITLFCLGTAGRSAPSQQFVNYLQETKSQEASRDAVIVSSQILSFSFSGYHAGQVDSVNLLDRLYQCVEPNDTAHCAYALLALHCNPYPEDSEVFNTVNLSQKLLSYQNPDGGFRMGAARGNSSVENTALAILALSVLSKNDRTSAAIEQSFQYLESVQQPDGEFLKNNEPSASLCARVLTAVVSVYGSEGVNSHFLKDGKDLSDVLMRYVKSNGSFSETPTGDSDLQATELAIVALSAIQDGQNPYLLPVHLTPQKSNTAKQSKTFPFSTLATPSSFLSTHIFYVLYGLLFFTMILYACVARFDISEFRKQEIIRRCLKKLRKSQE